MVIDIFSRFSLFYVSSSVQRDPLLPFVHSTIFSQLQIGEENHRGSCELEPTDDSGNCQHHRRSVAASLVQGVYVLECERQQNHQGSEVLAPPWWEFFHFELIRKLVDDADSSFFGAIYEFKPPASNQDSNAPKFVIAFRGTITKKESLTRDLTLDLHIIQNCLHRSSRFEIAMQAVRNVVSAAGSSNIWLAGHSLGSAMATLAGKNMAKMGILLETFLFNPPFFSAPIERIKYKNVKQGIRIASSLITAGLSVALTAHHGKPVSEDSFALLSSWIPNLFVNPGDHICSEYIGYFEHRRNMEEIGAGYIERLATQNSIGDLFLTAFGKESEPLHLLPSANLTVNLSPSPDFRNAHGLHQWWKPDQHLQSKQYIYR
ncbi:GDSL esterase/lipase At4g10955 isoform X1 [Elaeis guineensis]|uniref:GDSL esterase/lipase At4g10955 isoform X1 n=1 Tax=Elaeis guineensis var. tenera TaxID=51953 RepID=A0A6J0PGS3_ELAGV|nr:GDSL esterase/lipase At4g10955 isoform X1 [Elaeis guineensis]